MAEYGKREKKFIKASEPEKLKILREADDLGKLYYLELINASSPSQAESLAKKANFWSTYRANQGKGGGQLPATTFKPSKGSGKISYEQELPESTQAYKDLALREAQINLPEMLQRLRTPYTSPLTNQFESMFSHLQNPILQSLINPQAQNMARGSLFPEDIEREYQMAQMQPQQFPYQQPSGPLSNLMNSLGQQAFQQYAVPWMQNPENMQWLINQGQQGLGQLYGGAQNTYNYLTQQPSSEQLDQMSLPAILAQGLLSGAASPFLQPRQFAQNVVGAGQSALQGINSLLSKLGSYIPGRSQQQGV